MGAIVICARSTSQSPRARRQAHQPSPPPARIPQQTDAQARPSKPLRAQSLNQTDVADFNPFDPFVVSSPNDQQSNKASKPIAFRALPELTRPSGKLARRRQSTQFTSPKPIPRVKEEFVPVVHSEVNLSTPKRRPANRRVSTGPVMGGAWDFPICDDSDDMTPPSTPIRESASVPAKRTGATWQQQAFFDDAPRTAPPSAVFGYPFPDRASNATPTPAERRRHHRRVPSEGMFAMSTDDDSSSSDASEELKALVGLIPKRRAQVARRTPSPATPDSLIPAGFYAGSVFQNSPSPDELPVPAFRA